MKATTLREDPRAKKPGRRSLKSIEPAINPHEEKLWSKQAAPWLPGDYLRPPALAPRPRPVLYRPCRPTTEALPPPALLKRSKEAGSGGRPMAGGGGEPACRAPRVPGCGCGRAARSREGRGPPRRQPPLAARPVCRNSLSSLGLLEASLKGRAFLQLLSFDVPAFQNLSLLLPICLSTLYSLQSSKNAILAVFITKS